MKTNLLLIILTIVALVSCKKASVRPDTENPELPAYSEQGLNAGGMLINNKSWISSRIGLFSTARPLQLFSYPNGDSIVVLLNGGYKDSRLQYQQPRTIFIVLKNIRIATDNDLLKLNGKSYNLDGNINYGGFSDSYGYKKTGNSVGNITFGKVSEINNITYGDGSPNNPILHPYIVSGRLEMNLTTTTNYVLTKGRFDVNILRSYNQFAIIL
ncbi:hypothetical protein I5M32_03220 [Pedobacter sp. SD-b]|uniref:DUF5689 domain-containing protein n=1 Tax=Pedobacter segetis TaxID=2793069 RepID=A0ABS1BGH0_9SPHI|nr:hypothetical protein [Pedobacter segetis]MBK0381959.1 hypothetical protein [Pedobacter segetis]